MSAKAKVKALEKRLRRIEGAGEEIEFSFEPYVCDCKILPGEDDDFPRCRNRTEDGKCGSVISTS